MAEYKKSRTPYYLKDDDYDNFLCGVEKYHDDHGGDADFFPHWAILGPLVAAFHGGYQAFVAARQLIDDTKRGFDDAVKALRESMIGLRRQLPVLIRDDSVLGHFGLEEDVPKDVDLLLVNARICRDYWDSLNMPDPPPEYLALVDKLDGNSVLLTATEDAQRAYADAIRDREEARVVKDEAREACNAEERSMFAWYRGIWTDAEDDRWSATPWGASSGGGEEEPEPEPEPEPGEPHPAKVKNLIGELHIEVPIITLAWDPLEGAEKYNLKKYIGAIGEIAPPPPADYWKTDWIPNDIGETDIMPGMRHFYWVCGVDAMGVDGDWAMVFVDFPI